MFVRLAFAALMLCTLSACSPSAPPDGRWEGALESGDTMIVARAWTAQFMWYVHSRAAIRAGLSKDVADAVAAGKRPTSMKPDEAVVYNFCDELLTNKHVSDATYKAVVDQFGEKGTVDLMGNLGYFNMVAMLLNVDRYPLPDGVTAPLQPLK